MSSNSSSGGNASQASSDLYGAGVRAGFYLQGWSFLINCFFSDITEIPSQILPTIILITKKAIGRNEILVTMGIVQSAIFPALYVLNIVESQNGGIGIVLTLIDVALSIGTFLYLSADISTVDKAGFAFGFISLITTLFLFYKPLIYTYRMILRFWRGKPESEIPPTKLWDVFKIKAKKGTPDSRIPIINWGWVLPIWSVLFMIIWVIVVERAIKRRGLHPNNQIQQPGQLIPLVTGVLSWIDANLLIL